MKVTSVRVKLSLVVPPGQGDRSRVIAFATVFLDDCFVVSHIRVMEVDGRRMVAWPSRPGNDGRYVDVAYPRSEELREHIREKVLEKTESELEKIR